MKNLMLKMMLSFGLLVSIICGVFLVFSGSISSHNLRVVGEDSLIELRDSWGTAIRSLIESEEHLLEAIARRALLMHETLSMEERLASLRVDLAAIEDVGCLGFGLIEPNGIMHSTGGAVVDISSENYFISTMNGENFVSDPFISNFDSHFGNMIRVSVVPFIVNNVPVGGLLLIRDGHSLSDTINGLSENIAGGSVIFSLDTGATVGHINPVQIGNNIIEAAKTDSALEDIAGVLISLTKGESGSAEYTSTSGHDRLGFYSPIPDTPWGILVYNNIENVLARSENLFATMISFSIFLIIVALAITFVISRNISLPIKYATEQIHYFADGDLFFENNLQRYESQKDEIGIIARSLHTLRESLSDVFMDIRNGAQQVANGSQQISISSQFIASVASEQAASTEEISSTMEEMASNITKNADNAMKTKKIATQTVENAHTGKEAVNESLEAVQKIAVEISTIGSIASQTNLLALNAAIEAARAGETGKGFAVVASEVRKLAERSQIAAHEINVLSSKTIEAAERADEVISNVIPEIEQTSVLIEEISSASKEQNIGAQQVTTALVQMDVGVQQNASSSEELASMAQELAVQAEKLIETLSFFKLNEEYLKSKKTERKFIEDSASIPKQTQNQ